MNWAWATSLDQLWRSPTFPMWLTLAAAAFFGIIVLLTLLRAEKSVANGALTVITLLAIGIAVAAIIRGYGPDAGNASRSAGSSLQVSASAPALSCVDDLAGDTVEGACEKILFGSPDIVAAAVSYAAAQITRLTALGDVAAANRIATPELQALRRTVERDRYGLIAYVLVARDRCTPSDCAAFQSVTDHNQIAANMEERIYEGHISRYSPSWNSPAVASAPTIPGLASMPTGKPTSAEFPTAASIPPVNIMTPEPPLAAASAPRPAVPPAAGRSTPPRPAAVKKPPTPKTRPAAQPPVQLAPAPAAAKTDE